MSEHNLPQSVRAAHGLVGRHGSGRARAYKALGLSRASFRHYRRFLQCGMGFQEAYAKALTLG